MCVPLTWQEWHAIAESRGQTIDRLAQENAKLRERIHELEMEGSDHFYRTAYAEDANRTLEVENAKLRELVRDMWRFTGAACKKYPRLFDPAAQGGQMVQPNAIDAFEQRIRELGVEV